MGMNRVKDILKSMGVTSQTIEYICSKYPRKDLLHEALRDGSFECPYQYLTFETELEQEIRKLRKGLEIKWHKGNGDWVSSCNQYRIEPLYWGCDRPTAYKLFIGGKHYYTAGKLRCVKDAANIHYND